MRDKKWKDCPSCGASDSMTMNHKMTFDSKRWNIHLKNLVGFECRQCKDGIFTIKSNNVIEAAIARARAIKIAKQIPFDVLPVREAAAQLAVSQQAVHKMMNEGRLQYAFIAQLMLPLKSGVVSMLSSRRRAGR